MAEPLGELEVLIGGDLSNLDEAIREAQDHAETGAQAIASAFDIPDAAQTLADSIAKVGVSAETTAPELGHVGEQAHEAESGFALLGEKALELAPEIIGVGSALEALKTGLEAFSEVQNLTTSFTLLTGSAATASEQVEALKSQAIALAIPFDQLASEAQRMVPAFGSFEAVVPVLRAAADAAAVTGRDFDTVAAALTRIEVTGQVSSRQLVALGISWGQIAESMGTSIADAEEKLKKGGQDAEADVAAVVKTIEDHFAGGAEAMAANLSGQFTVFKNEVAFALEEVGKAAEPVASELLHIASGIVQIGAAAAEAGLTTLVSAFTDLRDILVSVKEAWDELPSPVRTVMDLAASAGVNVQNLDFHFKDLATDAAKNVTPLGQVSDLLHQIALLGGVASGTISGMGTDMENAAKHAENLATASMRLQGIQAGALLTTKELTDSTRIFGEGDRDLMQRHADLEEEVRRSTAVYEGLLKAYRDHVVTSDGVKVSLGALAQAHQEVIAAQTALNNSMGKQKDTLAEIVKAQNEANQTLHNAQAALDTLKAKSDGSTDSLNKIARATEDLDKAWKGANPALELALKNMTALGPAALAVEEAQGKANEKLAEAQKQYDLVAAAQDGSKDKADELVRANKDLKTAWEQANPALEAQLGLLKLGKEGFTSMADAARSLPDTLSPIIKNIEDIGVDLGDTEVDSGNLLDAMRRMGIGSAEAEQQILDNLRNLFQAMIAFKESVHGDVTPEFEADMKRVGDAVTRAAQQIQSDQGLSGSLKQAKTHGVDMAQQIGHAIESDLSKAMSDIIFQTGKIGDAFVKLGNDVVDIILNHIIKEALKPLLEELDNVLGKIGIGGGGGGTPKVPGVGTDQWGGLTSGGGAGGLLGSITGIVGAVGSVVTAIGTFIEGGAENTKLFHIETSLVEIRNTLQGYHDPIWRTAVATEYVLGQIQEVDYPLFSRMVTALEDMDGIMKTGIPVSASVNVAGVPSPGVGVGNTYNLSWNIVETSNPTATAQAVFNQLRTVLPQFAAASG